MGKTLNDYFSSVYTLEKDINASEVGQVNNVTLQRVHITEEEVPEVLKQGLEGHVPSSSVKQLVRYGWVGHNGHFHT